MTNKIKSDETIGTLKWVIYDTAAKGLLSRGEKTLHTSDVQIKPIKTSRPSDEQTKPIKILYDKKIELGDHFSFSLADSADREDIATARGFGLTGRRDDERSFAWDWFQVDDLGHAKKLQESGELSFDAKATPNGREINRMEFLTDVSIRISRMNENDLFKTAWRINILQGSVIYWPALVNGEVQSL